MMKADDSERLFYHDPSPVIICAYKNDIYLLKVFLAIKDLDFDPMAALCVSLLIFLIHLPVGVRYVYQ